MTATSPSVTGLYVGASGFSYPSWRGEFYPEEAKPAEFLEHYAQRLTSVELNNTFYRLPSEEQFQSWAARTPEGFKFAVKMTRNVTYAGGLDKIGTFCERVRTLGDRLGPVLVRMPTARPRDEGFLRLFLDSLDPELEFAFDFRHESWDEVDVPVRVNSLEGDAPFRYLRFRDPPYSDGELEGWAARLRPLLDQGIRVYCYFRHEDEPTAPRYAERLRALLGQSTQ
ncbi:MAG: DUF72 domain-containing protein [Actinomycetota bacterium]|nr:DUF72 domain-containing protein [Actinomycetota bacterium]